MNKAKNREVILPYRRGFITTTALPEAVADTLTELSKLELAIEELTSRTGGDNGGNSGCCDEIKKELEALEKKVDELLEALGGEDIIEALAKIKEIVDNLENLKEEIAKEVEDAVMVDVKKETDALWDTINNNINISIQELEAAGKELSTKVDGLNTDVNNLKEEWKTIGEDVDKKIKDANDILDSELSQKIKEGDEYNQAQLAEFKGVVAEEGKVVAQEIEGLKGLVGTNTANITELNKIVVTNQESTAESIKQLEVQYTNVNDTANQALDEAHKAGEIALNSTRWMKTYNIKAAGTSVPQPTDPEDFRTGVREMREQMQLGTGAPTWNLVVIDRKAQAKIGDYNWDLSTNDGKWIQDFKNRVESFDDNYIQMVYTDNHTGTAHLAIMDALIGLGGTAAAINSIIEGGAYILVGFQGVSRGLEYVTRAGYQQYIDITLEMYRKNIVGLDGFTSAQYDEIIKELEHKMDLMGKEIVSANAKIQAEEAARVSADEAMTERLNTMQSDANGNFSKINTQLETHTTAIDANAKAVEGMQSKVGAVEAEMADLKEVTTSQTESLAKRVETAEANVKDNTAAIKAEEVARADGDKALGERITTVSATVKDNEAKLETLEGAIAESGGSMAWRVDRLEAGQVADSSASIDNSLAIDENNKKAGKNFARITTEMKTVVDDNKAMALQVQKLEASMDGVTAELEETKEVIVRDLTEKIDGVDGKVNATDGKVDGLNKEYHALWGIKTTVNEVTASIGLLNDSSKGSVFYVDANRMVVSDAAGGHQDMFEISGGKTRIKNAIIGIANIGSANIVDGSITNAKIENAAIDSAKIKDLSVGEAKIVNASITGAKIKDAAITEAKIENGSITNAKIGNVIQSNNYSSGSAGWKIDKSGYCDFQQVTVRGTITATSGVLNNVIINDSCTIKGTLNVDQIKGDVVRVVTLSNGGSISISPESYSRKIVVPIAKVTGREKSARVHLNGSVIVEARAKDYSIPGVGWVYQPDFSSGSATLPANTVGKLSYFNEGSTNFDITILIFKG